MMTAEDIAHSDLVDVVAQACPGTLDTATRLCGMLIGHADDELLEFVGDAGPTQFVSCLAAVKLVCNQALIPSHKGIRGSKGWRALGGTCGPRDGQGQRDGIVRYRQSVFAGCPIWLGEAVFFLEVGDDLLVAIDPYGNHGDKDVEYHRRSLS
jgi:hypothetical protein